MNMKALVINLDSATERMAFQTKQLQHLKIDFQRISAYKIDTIEDTVYQEYYNTWQNPMSISEVSCFFSHKVVWDLIVKNNEPMIVLEDDAFLASNISQVINGLQKQTNIDYVNIETRYKRRRLIAKLPKQKIGDYELYRLYQGRSGTGGYILWPSGAKQLLIKMEKEGIGLVDKFINSAYSLVSYQVSPAPLIQIDQCHIHQLKSPIEAASSISKYSNKKSPPLKYRYRRIIGQIKIGLNYLCNIHHAEQKSIDISPSFLDKIKY